MDFQRNVEPRLCPPLRLDRTQSAGLLLSEQAMRRDAQMQPPLPCMFPFPGQGANSCSIPYDTRSLLDPRDPNSGNSGVLTFFNHERRRNWTIDAMSVDNAEGGYSIGAACQIKQECPVPSLARAVPFASSYPNLSSLSSLSHHGYDSQLLGDRARASDFPTTPMDMMDPTAMSTPLRRPDWPGIMDKTSPTGPTQVAVKAGPEDSAELVVSSLGDSDDQLARGRNSNISKIDKSVKNRESQRKYRERQKNGVSALQSKSQQQQAEIQRLTALVNEQHVSRSMLEQEKRVVEQHNAMLLERVKELERQADQGRTPAVPNLEQLLCQVRDAIPSLLQQTAAASAGPGGQGAAPPACAGVGPGGC